MGEIGNHLAELAATILGRGKEAERLWAVIEDMQRMSSLALDGWREAAGEEGALRKALHAAQGQTLQAQRRVRELEEEGLKLEGALTAKTLQLAQLNDLLDEERRVAKLQRKFDELERQQNYIRRTGEVFMPAAESVEE